MTPLSRKTIEKYFEFMGNKATCKICSRILKSNRMFNLKTHLIKLHKMKEGELKHNSRVDTYSAEKKIKKQAIKIEVSKKQLFRSYIGLVTENGIPFNILNTENFKTILDPICNALSEKLGKNFCLNSSSCKSALQLVSENIKNGIRLDLYQRLFSLKIDSATELSRCMFSISAQFINSGEIQSRILGIAEMKGVEASSSQKFATAILNTLTKYDVSLSQIVSITVDNCANMIHPMNILSQSSIFDNGQDVENFYEANEIYLTKMQMLENTKQIILGDIEIYPSATHIAQLCVLDIVKDSENKHFLLSCRNLVKFVGKPSNGYLEFFELEGLSVPQLDCQTKWGSTYTMIKSVQDAKDILVNINPIKSKLADENFELDDSFWKFIEAYCIICEPLQQALVKFKEEQLHYGNFYAEWLKCKICTEKLLERRQNAYTKKIGCRLVESMEIGTEKLLSNEILISCLYLDPRFNHTLTPKQKLAAITYLKKLYERMRSINMSYQEIKTEPPTSSYMENTKFSEKADEYLNEYLTRNFVPHSNDGVEVFVKLENLQMPFLRVDSNVLQFWGDKQYTDPELHALSNICFSVPATHITIEGTFSSLKHVLADNSEYIDHDTFEDILLVKLNTEYLDQAIENLPLFENDE